MEIINGNLNFLALPEKRDTDFYSHVNTKIVLMGENMKDIQLDFLHQTYQAINFVGIPYHYVVMTNGTIYLGRPRMYRAGFQYSYQNILNNAVCILIEGLDSDPLTKEQIDSVEDLLTMIVLQDNLLVTDILSMRKICNNISSAEFNQILKAVSEQVSMQDPYRIIGDNDRKVPYSKIVTGGEINSFTTIAAFSKIPAASIINMNKHAISLPDGTIRPGTTIFIPKNKVSDYCTDIYTTSLINTVYYKITSALASFKTMLESYGKETD